MSMIRKHGATIIVAMVTAVITAMVTAGGPALARTVVDFAKNAGQVDAKSAVGAKASVAHRKGKLVATSKVTGRLPNNIIATAPNAARLGGHKSHAFLLRPRSRQQLTAAGSDWHSITGTSPITGLWHNSLGWCAETFASEEMFQQVHLPQGARITGVGFDYRDDSSTTNGNGRVYILRMPRRGKGGDYTDLFAAHGADTATPGVGGTATAAPDNPADPKLVVDNRKQIYDLGFVGDSSTPAVCSATVYYDPPA
jgi:hypothetical protein